MATFSIILQIILVLVSVLLVGVILLQRNKGAGAGVTFGGAGDVFGAEMGNVLTKATIVLGSLFIVIVLTLSVITSRGSKQSLQATSVVDGYQAGAQQSAAAPIDAAGGAEIPTETTAEIPDAALEVIPDETAAAQEVAPVVTEEAAPAVTEEAAPAPVPAPAPAEVSAEAPAAAPAPAPTPAEVPAAEQK